MTMPLMRPPRKNPLLATRQLNLPPATRGRVALGLTAAFATALTKAGISANVVAAFHHDHIFVPERDAERALETLRALSRTARDKGEA